MTTTKTTVYATDGLTIKADDNGTLYMTTNAVTDEQITPHLYRGWSVDQIDAMLDQLVAEGMPQDLANRIGLQTEVWS